MRGITLFWNRLDGYGFIAPDDGTADVFAHHSSLLIAPPNKKLDKGQVVEFDVADRRGKRVAFNVRPISSVGGGQ
jgi:CspA family cold shock protein